MTTKKRRARSEKIPESVERTEDSTIREKVITKAVDAMLDALNCGIKRDDLTFEEALHASDIVHLSILAKYINFRIDQRFDAITSKKMDRSVGIA